MDENTINAMIIEKIRSIVKVLILLDISLQGKPWSDHRRHGAL